MAITGYPQSATNNGGSGGVTNRYAGVWDLSQGSAQVIEAVPDPSKSTGFIKVNDSEFTWLGDNVSNFISGTYYDWVIAEGVSPLNSGVRWGSVDVPDISNTDTIQGVAFGVTTNEISPTQILSFFTTATSPSPLTGILFTLSMVSVGIYTLAAFVLSNMTNASPFTGNQLAQLTFFEQQPLTTGTKIYYGIDTNSGSVFVQVGNASPILPTRVLDFQTLLPVQNPELFTVDLTPFTNSTFSPFYSPVWSNTPNFSATNPNTFKFDLGSTADGKLPFLSVITETAIPANAKDGEVYECVNGSATVNGAYVQSGDFVEFADNLSKLIVISKPKTTAQIEQIAQDKINANLLANGAIAAAIEAAKGALTEDLNIQSNTTYDIDPDVGIVTLNNGNGATGVIINLPLIQYQYASKRLLIVSYISSPDLIITAQGGYIGLGAINSVSDFDVFEFVAQPSLGGSTSNWARVK